MNATEDLVFYNSRHNHSSFMATIENVIGAFRAYVSPVLFLVGLMGNAVVIYIFRTDPRSKKSRFAVYCIFIATFNSLALILNTFMDDFFGRGLQYATKGGFFVKFDAMSTASCKFLEYIPNVMYCASSYVLVFFTIDRVASLMKPFHFAANYYQKKAVLLCVLILICSTLLCIPMILVHSLVPSESIGWKCTVLDPSSPLAKATMYTKSLVLFTVPSFIVLPLNCAIVSTVLKLTDDRRLSISTNAHYTTRERKLELGRIAGHFALSTLFLLLVIPLVVDMLIRLELNARSPPDNSSEYYRRVALMGRLLSSLKDFTYAVNVFMYFAFIPNFRFRMQELFARSVHSEQSLRDYYRRRSSAQSTAMKRMSTTDKSLLPMTTTKTNISARLL